MLLPILLGQPSGPQAYTLDAQPASFSLTGQAATTTATRTLNLASTSYTHTGQAATTLYGRALNLASTSFAHNGQAATTTATRTLNLASTSYTHTGQAATLTTAYSLNAEVTSYTHTGQAATVAATRELALDASSYAYAGQDSTLGYGRSFDAGATSYSLTGQDVTFERATTSAVLIAQAGTFSLTGADASSLRTYVESLTSTSFAVTGASAALEYDQAENPGVFTITGQDATLAITAIKLNAEYGNFDVLGSAAFLQTARVLKAQKANDGSYWQTGAYVELDYVDGNYVDSGYASEGYVEPIGFAYANYAQGGYSIPNYVGQDPGASFIVGRALNAQAGQIVLTGATASMVKEGLIVITAQQAAYIEQIARLHGLIDPLTVTQTSRSDGTVVQTITDTGSTVTMTTTMAGSTVFNPTWIDDLAAVYGLSAPLVVTATGRSSGTVSQTIQETGTGTVVTRV